jgi:hypothetical protein
MASKGCSGSARGAARLAVVLAVVLVATVAPKLPAHADNSSSTATAPVAPATDQPALPSGPAPKGSDEIPNDDISNVPPLNGVPARPAKPAHPQFDRAHAKVSARDARSTTYDNPEGSQTIELHTAPVNGTVSLFV